MGGQPDVTSTGGCRLTVSHDRVMREVRLEAASVPFKLYDPGNPNGLLLLGHRGGSGKDDPRIVEHAHRFADSTGLAVVCIDAPAHGERRPSSSDIAANREVVAATITGPQDVTVADWQAVVASLRDPRAAGGLCRVLDGRHDGRSHHRRVPDNHDGRALGSRPPALRSLR